MTRPTRRKQDNEANAQNEVTRIDEAVLRRGSLRIGARGLDAKNGGEIFAAITYAERCRKVQIWSRFAPQPNGGFSDEAICAGLDGAANLKIAASSGGRANRPYQKLSTVAPKKAKPLQAQQHTQPTNAAYLRHQRCLPPPPALLTSATCAAYLRHLRCLPPPPALPILATKGTKVHKAFRVFRG